ncbi:MAG TPA: hypothetical protein VLL07_05925, partial [Pontiella sp.]|nr:hypothetical protein [Pontiella sp.]
IIDEHRGKLRVLAFMVPRYVPPYTRVKTCLVSIDEIEQLTDLDFFPGLPEDTETELESQRATRLWPWIGSSLRYHLFL